MLVLVVTIKLTSREKVLVHLVKTFTKSFGGGVGTFGGEASPPLDRTLVTVSEEGSYLHQFASVDTTVHKEHYYQRPLHLVMTQ